MLKVNLLPENLRAKRNRFDFPIFPILFFGFLFLLLVYAVLSINVLAKEKVVKGINQDLQSVQAKSLEAGNLKDRIVRMNSVLQTAVLQVLFPEYSITVTLNSINHLMSDSMWLKKIDYDLRGEEPTFEVQGFVRRIGNESMITSIGRFNNELKKSLENQKQQLPVYLTDGLIPLRELQESEQVDFSVTTKRRQADRQEITEFTTRFSL